MFSNLRFITLFVFTLPGNVENGAQFLESKTMAIGHDAAEFWSPWNFFVTFCHQRDLIFGVFLILMLQKLYIFKILTLTYNFKVICYRNQMTRHSKIILLKTRWKSVEWCWRSTFFFCFSRWHLFHPENWV